MNLTPHCIIDDATGQVVANPMLAANLPALAPGQSLVACPGGVDNQGNPVEAGLHRWDGAQFVRDEAAALARARTARLIELQRGLDRTLARKADGTDRYPPNWLAGAREVVAAYDAVLADPALLTAVATALGQTEAALTAAIAARKASATAVLHWQFNGPCAYFYAVKIQLVGAADLAALEAVAWDWTPYYTEAEGGDPSTADPDVSLDADVSIPGFMAAYVAALLEQLDA